MSINACNVHVHIETAFTLATINVYKRLYKGAFINHDLGDRLFSRGNALKKSEPPSGIPQK